MATFTQLSWKPRKHHPIKLDAEILDLYTGNYELTPGHMMPVSREGDKLMAQMPEAPRSSCWQNPRLASS